MEIDKKMTESKEETNHFDPLNRNDKIARAFALIEKESPSYGFGISFINENTFSIFAASYENALDNEQRRQVALKEVSSLVDGLLKKLKENYKKEYKETLSSKILGEGSDVECISSNGKYKLSFKRMYTVGD